MTEAELIEILRASEDFASVSGPSLAGLARAGVVREPAAGSEIIRQGETSPQVWVLIGGELEILIDGAVINRVTRPGEVVGQISAVSHVPATATVRVSGAAKCLSVSQQSLHGLFGSHPDLAAALLRSMAKYLGGH